ncbi:MAG TPA: hypothetical protein VNC41_16765, partial [Acidimicrobiia bacterium]|nr:hypothetical protein [Acidimicrobiia bacterium]
MAALIRTATTLILARARNITKPAGSLRNLQASPPERSAFRREGVAFAELFAMCGFAIVQPLLSVLGQSPD